MNRIDRLFGILTLLQSRKYVSAEKIAEKFGMSVRTVYRDIKALNEQGIPVSFEQPHGYYIVQGYFLPPVSFTSDEANALVLMENIVRVFSDNSVKGHYSTALNKVKAVLRNHQRDKLEILSNNIRLQVPECFNIGNYEYLSVIQNSITARNIIRLEYKNKQEQVSRRDVEPIGLVFYAMSWHLIAWCKLKYEDRDFRISRILRVTDLEIPYSKEEHISLDDYVKELPVAF